MTERRACPPAPGPLEKHVTCFDGLLVSSASGAVCGIPHGPADAA
nr:hypothetical protein [Streptomyces roseirectus]